MEAVTSTGTCAQRYSGRYPETNAPFASSVWIFRRDCIVTVIGGCELHLHRRRMVSLVKIMGEVTLSMGNIPTHSARRKHLLDPHGVES